MTPPYTPLPSKPSSIYEQYVAQPEQWRRPSVESRLSEKVPVEENRIIKDLRRSQEVSRPAEPRPVVQTPIVDLITPVGSDKELPKPVFKSQKQDSVNQTGSANEMPHPILRRKTSRFIEHIETVPTPEPAPIQVHFSRPFSQTPREPLQRSGSTMTALAQRSVNIQVPKRSESMRQPSRGSGHWGAAVVCTAEARSVVASGTAKLVLC